MPVLFNTQTKRWDNVADDVVTQGVSQGIYAPRRGAQMTVMNPIGQQFVIDAQEAQEAFNNGWSYLSRDQSKQITDNKIKTIYQEEFDDPLTAFGAGALRGATFGLSDVGMRLIGGEETATGLRQLEEVSPIASTAGEIGGALATLAPGTLGLGGRALTKLGTGVSEATVGKLAGKFGMDNILTKAAKAGVGSAIEGLGFGAGQLVSEAALNDPKLTTEHAFQVLGTSAILGGALGFGTKAAGETLGKFKELLQQSTLPTTAANSLGKLFAKLTTLSRGLNEEESAAVMAAFSTQSGRQKALAAIEDRGVHNQQMLEAVTQMKEIAPQMKTVWGNARESARAELDKFSAVPLKGNANKTLVKNIDETIQAMEAKPSYFPAGVSDYLGQVKTDLIKDLSKATRKSEVHEAVENARQLVDKQMKFSKLETNHKTIRAEKTLQKLRDKLVNHLEDTKLYGEFGKKYHELNSAFSKFTAAEDDFLKLFGTKGKNEFGQDAIIVDPVKITKYLDNPEAMRNMRRDLNLDQLTKATEGLAQSASKVKTTDSLLSDYLVNVSNTTKTKIDDLKELRGIGLQLNALEVRTGKSMIGGVGGALLGGAGGGLLGVLPGFLVGSAVSSPASVVKILTRLENLGIAGTQRVQSNVSKFYGNKLYKDVSKYADKYAAPVTLRAAIELLGGEGNTHEDLKKTIEYNLQDYQKMGIHFASNSPDVEHVAPEVTKEVNNKIIDIMQFIHSKIPNNATNDMFGTRDIKLSDSQKRTVDTYVDAAFRPERIYEEMTKYRPDPRVVEAVQSLYPAMYGEIQKEVMKQATESKISYDQKLVLGKLFAIPTVPSLDNINKLQQNFIVAPTQTQAKTQLNLKSVQNNAPIGDKLQLKALQGG